MKALSCSTTLRWVKSIMSGGWNLSKSNIDGKFLQATYSGVVVYDANDLSRYRQIRDFYKPIKYVTQNKRNEV
jgi:hypothetical protein